MDLKGREQYRAKHLPAIALILAGIIGLIIWRNPIDPGLLSPVSDVLAAPSRAGAADAGGDGDSLGGYLQTAYPPADGFDFPVGDRNGQGAYVDLKTGKAYHGWYIAQKFLDKFTLGIHPGVDWNGRGGGNTDLGQSVWAVANGKVVFAGSCGPLCGNIVVIEHLYYENHEKKTIYSVYAHLGEVSVQADEIVSRRRKIGTVGRDPAGLLYAHLHFELRFTYLGAFYWPSAHGRSRDWIKRNYASPQAFIAAHRQLPVPQKEATLIIVDQGQYKMQLFKNGRRLGVYDVSFGQSKGRKRRQGDNKTPKGMYFVIQHHRGDFSGPYGQYYGGHWIKINYPNPYDAAWGRANKLTSADVAQRIARRWRKRRATVEKTPLGGGIGFHGWVREWDNDGPRHLSWGCIVMHNRDIKALYDQIPIGAMVIIR